MSKAYELQRIEAMNRMRNKRRDVIMNTVKKNIEGKGEAFQEVLDLYRNKLCL